MNKGRRTLVRIQIRLVVGFEGGGIVKVEHGLHLLAIPLLDVTCSGRVVFTLIAS